MLGQELREPGEGRTLDNRQIVSVHHMRAAFASRLDKVSKMFAQFGGASSDVDHRRAVFFYPFTHTLRRLVFHHLASPRRSIDMTMTTGLVAFAAHIDLES